ncbi:uncharacterized protein LOC110876744 [Helianthus annuus]|uniref:uncharacterized protein LOC110876744 n=1 Tax=Helianthus annuus TaxID=4232 RepID=UPI000B8FE87D|nr:uncharacterized protein LOC110876744 [Helianthus annuus]
MWIDPWLIAVPLKDRFPMLFNLEKDKRCLEWTRTPNAVVELQEWNDLIELLDDVIIKDTPDKWVWMGGNNKEFSVKALKEFLISSVDFSDRFVMQWPKWVPRKCCMFMWRVVMDQIPTLSALQTRNTFSEDVSCSMCGDDIESAYHLLCVSQVASEVWFHISRWCKVNPFIFISVKDLVEAHEFYNVGSVAKEALHGIMHVATWCICVGIVLHGIICSIEVKPKEIFQDIKSLSFLWFRNRSKYRNLCWKSWCKFEF